MGGRVVVGVWAAALGVGALLMVGVWAAAPGVGVLVMVGVWAALSPSVAGSGAPSRALPSVASLRDGLRPPLTGRLRPPFPTRRAARGNGPGRGAPLPVPFVAGRRVLEGRGSGMGRRGLAKRLRPVSRLRCRTSLLPVVGAPQRHGASGLGSAAAGG
ncbi:hypothetical protein AMK26_08230 [Streptomyces sp. CB03234]|nr:hypothetical protein AMK26_08230 [Streptomyces sp. CB03234]